MGKELRVMTRDSAQDLKRMESRCHLGGHHLGGWLRVKWEEMVLKTQSHSEIPGGRIAISD